MKTIKILVLFFICSCSGNRNSQLFEKGGKNEAIQNAITDFAKNEINKKNMAYRVLEVSESDELYCFIIGESPQIYPIPNDTIGATSEYFPTHFKEINKRLYIWEDTTAVITKEIIQNLHKYKIVDSTIYKIKTGELSVEDSPILKTNDSKKEAYYYICKENIKKYKKIRTNRILAVEDYPKVDCGR